MTLFQCYLLKSVSVLWLLQLFLSKPLFVSLMLFLPLIFLRVFLLPVCIWQCKLVSTPRLSLRYSSVVNACWHRIRKLLRILKESLFLGAFSFPLGNSFLPFLSIFCFEVNLSYLWAYLDLSVYSICTCHILLDQDQTDQIHAVFAIDNTILKQSISLQFSSLPPSISHQLI